MRFTLNAIDDIQERFASTSRLGGCFQTRNRIKAFGISNVVINGHDCVADETGETPEHLDKRYVGRYIDATNMQNLMGNNAVIFGRHRAR